MREAQEVLGQRPAPRYGRAVLQAHPTPPGKQGRRERLGHVARFLEFAARHCGVPARYRTPEAMGELIGKRLYRAVPDPSWRQGIGLAGVFGLRSPVRSAVPARRSDTRGESTALAPAGSAQTAPAARCPRSDESSAVADLGGVRRGAGLAAGRLFGIGCPGRPGAAAQAPLRSIRCRRSSCCSPPCRNSPPPEAIPVPFKDSPEWDAFCRVNPLHMAACGKASEAVTTAWINQIVKWFHKGGWRSWWPWPIRR